MKIINPNDRNRHEKVLTKYSILLNQQHIYNLSHSNTFVFILEALKNIIEWPSTAIESNIPFKHEYNIYNAPASFYKWKKEIDILYDSGRDSLDGYYLNIISAKQNPYLQHDQIVGQMLNDAFKLSFENRESNRAVFWACEKGSLELFNQFIDSESIISLDTLLNHFNSGIEDSIRNFSDLRLSIDHNYSIKLLKSRNVITLNNDMFLIAIRVENI